MNEITEMIYKIEFFSCYVEILLCTYFCSAFMETSKKKKSSKISIVMAFLLAAIAIVLFFIYRNNFIYSYKQRLLFFALCVIMQWIYFHRKFFLPIVATIVYAEIAMVAEIIVEWMIQQASMFSNEEEVAILLCRIVVITIWVLIAHGIVPRSPLPSIYLVVTSLSAMIFIFYDWLLVGAEGQVEMLGDYTEFFLQSIFIVFFIFQIIVVFFVLKIAEGHQQKQTNALIELNNKMLKRSLDETEQTFELWRQSIHDYKNHVIILKQMAEEERLDDIKSYLNQEGESINKQLFMVKTGNSVVDTIVNIKKSLAEKHHIAFMVHANLPNVLILEDMDIANILGNLLDNAIEASLKEEEPYIDVTMIQEKSFLILNIRNKCTQVSEMELGKTSKEQPEFHGIGIKSVKRTVKKYDGQINIEQYNQEYIVSIMIQNKQEK